MTKYLMAGAALLCLTVPALAAETMTVETSAACNFTIKLRADLAPRHVAQITKLAAAGFYDGVVFHRVIDGFMAQTGDPTGTGMGSSNEPDIPAEFTTTPFTRGIVGMARSDNPDSANSQFFVMLTRYPSLDNKYTVWGEVDDAGMVCLDKIKKGDPQTGLMDNPDKMIKVTVQ